MSISDEDYENPWTYQGSRFSLPDEELEKYVGFVYLIQCTKGDACGKKYIGQKLLWFKRKGTKTNPKTKVKRTVRKVVQSDWKSYYGSSEELKSDVARLGKDAFSREILRLCRTKGDMNYIELVEQVDRKVILKDDYYNSFVGKKIHRRHVSSEVSKAES